MTGEAPRQFLDTNVLVYAHDRSAAAKQARALSLLGELVTAGAARLSVQVLQEFFTVVTGRVRSPMPVPAARAIVADLGSLPLHEPGANDVLAAIDIHERHRISFWDAMVLRSAGQMGCDVVWSEDLAAGQAYGGVQVRNPFA